jgi:anti-sigma regulatory factor (Ser/Thr protein kinase)
MAQVISVTRASDVHLARQAARSLATAIGFDVRAAEEIVIAVSELASNLTRHARGGSLTLTPIAEGERRGLRVESRDLGPGIADAERAVADGFSTAGGLGLGLGAVNRLMDRLDIAAPRGAAGTTIVCSRWLRPASPLASPCPLEFGAATRALPSMGVNGDAFVIARWQASALVGVIDGLGHGQYAHRAAETARRYVETHVDQPLEAIFRGVARACQATRGVVMALVRFDFGARGVHFSVASVGNVEVRWCGGPPAPSFIVRRGIVGGQAPRPRVTVHRWTPGAVLVVHSDGVSARWQPADFPDPAAMSATALAQALLRRLARAQDDATVVVVKDAPREH